MMYMLNINTYKLHRNICKYIEISKYIKFYSYT